jgi:hypothetical protein
MQPLLEAVSFNSKNRRGVHPRSSLGKSPSKVCQQTASSIDTSEPKSPYYFKLSGFDVDTRQPISIPSRKRSRSPSSDAMISRLKKLASSGSPLTFTDSSTILITASFSDSISDRYALHVMGFIFRSKFLCMGRIQRTRYDFRASFNNDLSAPYCACHFSVLHPRFRLL